MIVDAAMYCPETTRLSMGLPLSSLLSSFQSSEETPPMKTDGSKVGTLARPSTSPLVQSRHTTAPLVAVPKPSWCA